MKLTEVSKGVVVQQLEQATNFILPSKSIQRYNLAPDVLNSYELWDLVVGSPAQVLSGLASHTSINAAIADAIAQNSMMILRGTYTENVIFPKELFVQGQGRGTLIDGTVEFQSTANYSTVQNLKFNNNLNFDSGTTGIYVMVCFQETGFSIIDGGIDNNIDVFQE